MLPAPRNTVIFYLHRFDRFDFFCIVHVKVDFNAVQKMRIVPKRCDLIVRKNCSRNCVMTIITLCKISYKVTCFGDYMYMRHLNITLPRCIPVRTGMGIRYEIDERRILLP